MSADLRARILVAIPAAAFAIFIVVSGGEIFAGGLKDFGRTFEVVRGGSWKFEPYYVRAAQRNLEYMPDVRGDQIGFRCVVP